MRILISILIALTAASLPGLARADAPSGERKQLRKQIRQRAFRLRVDKLTTELALSPEQKTQIETIIGDYDRKRQDLRKRRRKLISNARSAAKAGDDARSATAMSELFTHKRNAIALEAERAGALQKVLGAARALRATLILSRSERRIEQRMRRVLREHRRRNR